LADRVAVAPNKIGRTKPLKIVIGFNRLLDYCNHFAIEMSKDPDYA
jgi:hypothetical protein